MAEIQRPPFPPTEIALKRAFSSALKEVRRPPLSFPILVKPSLSPRLLQQPSILLAAQFFFSHLFFQVGPDIAMLWSFCTSFPELLGLSPLTTLEDLLLSIIEGSCSRLLGETHIALIRLALVCSTRRCL